MLVNYQLQCKKVALCLRTGATSPDDNGAVNLTLSQMWMPGAHGVDASEAIDAWQQQQLSSVERNLRYNPYSKKCKPADLSPLSVLWQQLDLGVARPQQIHRLFR